MKPLRKYDAARSSSLGAVIIEHERELFRSLVWVVFLATAFVVSALGALFMWGFQGTDSAILIVPFLFGVPLMGVLGWRAGVAREQHWNRRKIAAVRT